MSYRLLSSHRKHASVRYSGVSLVCSMFIYFCKGRTFCIKICYLRKSFLEQVLRARILYNLTYRYRRIFTFTHKRSQKVVEFPKTSPPEVIFWDCLKTAFSGSYWALRLPSLSNSKSSRILAFLTFHLSVYQKGGRNQYINKKIQLLISVRLSEVANKKITFRFIDC